MSFRNYIHLDEQELTSISESKSPKVQAIHFILPNAELKVSFQLPLQVGD